VDDVGLGSPRHGSGYDSLSGEEHLPGATFAPAVPLAAASRAARAGRPGGPAPAGSRGSTGAEDLGLAPGDVVLHDHWGRGVVVSAKGEGSRAQATVDFDSVGKKNLLLTATPLRRA
jgi:hypothetical protein